MKKQLLILLLTMALPATSYAAKLFNPAPGAIENADRGATLTWSLSAYPNTLNPIIYSMADEANIIEPLFESLISVDYDTGEPMCFLCTKYEYVDGKKAAVFELRKEAKFHDGKPLTAEDIKFTFDAYMHPKVDNLQWKSLYLSTIEKVEVLDTYKVKITFKDVKYANIYRVGGASIIPKHLFPYFEKNPEKFNKDQKFGRSPVGSGPYKFRKRTGNTLFEIVRNDDWWGFKQPGGNGVFNFKKIRFKVITDDTVQLQSFKKGEFDFLSLQSYQFDEIRKDKKKGKKLKVEPVHLVPKISTSFMFVALNSRQERFSDVQTRKALNLLMDRFSVLEKFSRGLRPPTNGSWGIESPYQCPKSECPIVEFSPKKGKELLAKAGWKDSDGDGVLDRTKDGKKQKLEFTVLAGQGDYYKNVLGVYSTEFRKAGIKMNIKQLDWSSMNKLIDELKFDAFISGFRAAYPLLPRQLWHSANTGPRGSNTWNFNNPEADKLIDAFEKEFDAKKRQKIGQKLHRLIYSSHSPIFHHEGGGCYVGVSKELKGVVLAPFHPECSLWENWYRSKNKDLASGS